MRQGIVNLILNNDNEYHIRIDYENPLGKYILASLKHLQHLPLCLGLRDLPIKYDKSFIYNQFLDKSKELNLNIDQRIDQSYLNYMHSIFEKQGPLDDLNDTWLEFHELIHLLENYDHDEKSSLYIDYRNKGGLLEKTFYREYLGYSTLTYQKGDVVMTWSELGKIPYTYWKNGEPNDIDRIKQLVKPWLRIRPCFEIKVKDGNSLKVTDKNMFIAWFSQYMQEWMDHWKISDWTYEEQFCLIKIGEIDNIDNLIDDINLGNIPVRITL